MNNNPKNHPKSSGSPAGGPEDATDLDAGATIIPRKAGDVAAKDDAAASPPSPPALDADKTFLPNKRPEPAANPAGPTKEQTVSTELPVAPEPKAAAIPAANPSPAVAPTPQSSTSERQLNSAPTVTSPAKGGPLPAKETGAVDIGAIPSSLEAGRKLGEKGRFALIRQLGKGGMGVVWLARDTSFNEDLALKLLPPEVAADPMAIDDLRNETKKSRQLGHPHIIRIYDLFEKDGEPAFVSMEFIDGPNLRKKLGEQPQRCFNWNYLRQLMVDLCDALEYAHGRKVIHRDLKPANVMLDKEGHLKLADFGIAGTLSDSVSRVSQRGQDALDNNTSGTLPYMSPQQLRGARPKPTDDIYSFGAMLYELLTSKPPFYLGVPEAVMDQIKHEPPHSIKERLEQFGIKHEVPDYVNELIMDCLAKEPEKRPQTAKEVKERLSDPGQPGAARPNASSQPELGPGGTVRSNASARHQTTAEVLDVDIAETRRSGGGGVLAKLVGVCIAILLLLGLAWHFASNSPSAVKPPPDASMPPTPGDGGGGNNPVGPSTPGPATPTAASANPNSPTPMPVHNNPNPVPNVPATPASMPNMHRLVILPDSLSDAAREGLSRSLQEQLGVDNSSLGEVSLAGYLRDVFVGAKGFTVLERDQLKPAMDEINLSAGKYGEAQLSKIGHLASADYILVPEIQSLSISKKSKELLGIPEPRVTLTGTMKANIRVVDVRSSATLSSGSSETSESITQMGEPADKLQAARDIIGKLLNKAAQAELSKVNQDVLHIEPPVAAPAK